MKSFKEWRDKDVTLFHKRKDGARKIAEEAKSKGGPSQMTAWHFYAKLPQYEQVFSVFRNSDPVSTVRTKFKSLVAQLSKVENMSQKEFQELMGEIEVWGEVLVQLEKPQDY